MPVINIRGTFGSGKTTIARNLIAEHKSPTSPEPEMVSLSSTSVLKPTKANPSRMMDKFVNGTLAFDAVGETLCALGKYDVNCGGCDTFSWKGAAPTIVEGIEEACRRYDKVVFEGAIVSSSFGRYANASLSWDLHPTFIYVLPDFETCLQRVHERTGSPITDRMRHSVTDKGLHLARQAQTALDFSREVNRKLSVYVTTDSDDAMAYAREVMAKG